MGVLSPSDDGATATASEQVVSLLEDCEAVMQDLRHAASRGVPPAPLLAQLEARWVARLEALASEVRIFLMTASNGEVARLMAHGDARVWRLAMSERGRRVSCRR